MSRPSPQYPSLLLFKPPSIAASKQLHAIKTPAMMLDWSKSGNVSKEVNQRYFLVPCSQSCPSPKYVALLLCGYLRAFAALWTEPTSKLLLQPSCSASSYTIGCTHLLCLEKYSSPAPNGVSITHKNIMFTLGILQPWANRRAQML